MRQYNRHGHAGMRLLGTGQVARMLHLEPSTLRTYELEGLVSPQFSGGRKGYSHELVGWIACVRHMIQEKGISIPGLKRLLRLAPCWEIAECPNDTRKGCTSCRFSLSLLERPDEWAEAPADSKVSIQPFHASISAEQAVH